MRSASRRLGILAFVLPLVVVPVRAQVTCTYEQITDTGGGVGAPAQARIDGSGQRVLFTTSRDLTGGNPDGSNEVFLWDAATATFTQVTDRATTYTHLSISGDGLWAAFAAPSPVSGVFEVWRAEIDTQTVVQLTPDAPAGTADVDIDRDGSSVSFSSRKDLTGENEGGQIQVFVWDQGSGFDQVSNGAFTAEEIALSASGRRVGHLGRPGSWWAAYFADRPGGSVEIAGVTSDGSQDGVALSDDGTQLFFVSPDDGNQELVVHDLRTGVTTPLTNTTGSWRHESPSASADGDRVVAEITDGFGRGVIFVDLATGAQSSLTPGQNSTQATIDDAGIRIAFTSTANLTGGNPDGNQEVYVATCPAPPARSVEIFLDATDVTWSAAPGAIGYDVVEGDLGALRAAAGDFATATDLCVADDLGATAVSHGADPAAGEGRWFLVRPVGSAHVGTYNAASEAQVGPRDAGIAAPGLACP